MLKIISCVLVYFYYIIEIMMEKRFSIEQLKNRQIYNTYLVNNQPTIQSQLYKTKRSPHQQSIEFQSINLSQSKCSQNIQMQQISLKDSKWIVLDPSVEKKKKLSLEYSRNHTQKCYADTFNLKSRLNDKRKLLKKHGEMKHSDINLIKKSKLANSFIKKQFNNISLIPKTNEKGQILARIDVQNSSQHQKLPRLLTQQSQNQPRKKDKSHKLSKSKSKGKNENSSPQTMKDKKYHIIKCKQNVKANTEKLNLKYKTVQQDQKQIKCPELSQLQHYMSITKCLDQIQLLNIQNYHKIMKKIRKEQDISKDIIQKDAKVAQNKEKMASKQQNQVKGNRLNIEEQRQQAEQTRKFKLDHAETTGRNQSFLKNAEGQSQNRPFSLNNYQNKIQNLQNRQELQINKKKRGYQSLNLTPEQIDQSFNLQPEFKEIDGIRFVNVSPNNQTAIFPVKNSKKTYLIQPTVNHFNYQNQLLISYLNFLLYANPSIIWSVFGQRNSACRYCCKLFDGQKVIWIEVDGIFPFDNNYYPLYAYVDQYIWFSVLLKCIAKMKGSYKSINEITFQELHYILTGLHISQNFDKQLLVQQRSQFFNKKYLENQLVIIEKQGQFYKLQKISKRTRYIKDQKPVKSDQYTFDDLRYNSLQLFLEKQRQKIKNHFELEDLKFTLKNSKRAKKIINFEEFLKSNYRLFIEQLAQPTFQQTNANIEAFSC